MSRWEDKFYEDWDMDGEIGDFDRFTTLEFNHEACEDEPFPDDDDDDYCDDEDDEDDEEDAEDDFEDIEDLYSAPSFPVTGRSTGQSETRTYSKISQAEVKSTHPIAAVKPTHPIAEEQAKAKAEELAKAEAEQKANEEWNKKVDIFIQCFAVILCVFAFIGVVFFLFANGDKTCETIGGIFLGIPIVIISLAIIFSKLLG